MSLVTIRSAYMYVERVKLGKPKQKWVPFSISCHYYRRWFFPDLNYISNDLLWALSFTLSVNTYIFNLKSPPDPLFEQVNIFHKQYIYIYSIDMYKTRVYYDLSVTNYYTYLCLTTWHKQSRGYLNKSEWFDSWETDPVHGHQISTVHVNLCICCMDVFVYVRLIV